MTNHWVDIKNADVVLIMGGNAAEAHPCGFKWVTEAKAHNKAKLIVVDPRFTRSASVADYYAPIRPGTAMRLRLGDPLEPARMRLGGIAAHHEDHIRIADVDPVIRHRTTAKRRGKTCHRRTVSDTRLVVECEHPHTAHGLVRQIPHLVAGG